MTPPPILITGFPRSGTSLVCGCLAACGVWTGDTRKENQFNEKGYFENAEIFNAIAMAGSPAKLRSGVHGVMKTQKYKSPNPWLFKAFELVVLKRHIWRDAWPGTIFVITKRSEEDVIASNVLANAARFHGKGKYATKEYWVDTIAKVGPELDKLEAEGAFVIDTDQLANGDFSMFRSLVTHTGLKWTTEATQFVSPELWGKWKEKT